MRRKILERKHVAGRKRDDILGIASARKFAKTAQHGNEILDSSIIVDDEDEWAVGMPAQKHEQQGFCRRQQSGDTNAPRALPQVGGNTREGGKHFYVREEFTDEGKQHENLILTGRGVESRRQGRAGGRSGEGQRNVYAFLLGVDIRHRAGEHLR